MSSQTVLPKSELEVARIVWEKGRATVREVCEALPRSDLDFKTVQTYLRRLEAKGYVRTRREGRTKVYMPRAKPKRVIREMIDDFIERLFDGEAMPLLQHVIQDRDLSAEEIERLRGMLKQLEERRDESTDK